MRSWVESMEYSSFSNSSVFVCTYDRGGNEGGLGGQVMVVWS